MPYQAYVPRHSVNPTTGHISLVSVVVIHPHGEALIDIPLEPPLGPQKSLQEIAAHELEQLGQALVRIAKTPASIILHDRPGS